MTLPTEPGVYQDTRGDLWLLGEDGLWEHGARRLNDGTWMPVMGQFTGRMKPEVFAHLATGPAVKVFPLKRVEIKDFPPPDEPWSEP